MVSYYFLTEVNMGKKIDHTGIRYNKLVGVEEVGKTSRGLITWRFKCDCGGELVAPAAAVKAGNTTSCGCRISEMLVERNKTHGMSKHPAYSNWKDMFKRCYNPNNKRFEHYSSKGIVVHEYFKYFPNFLEEIGEKPDDGQVWTIGRINNDKSYEPGNVRWETLTEQARNHSMQSNNTSGIVGVQLRNKEVKPYGFYESFVVTWKDHEGKSRTKNFSTNKYGFNEAKRLAIEYRLEKIKSLKEYGIHYGESHGNEVKDG